MSDTTTIDMTKLDGITLEEGGHPNPDAGLCLMEAVAYVRGIEHTDYPACVAPLLGEMGRSLNDALPHELRQLLVPLIPVLPGTHGDGHDETRSYMALDWLIRVHLPAWLDLSPACREDAVKVRELGRIVDQASAERAAPVVRQARSTAAAAWDAAGDAAWDTAVSGDAAEAVAGDTAGDAAWDAVAGDTAEAAAWAAAWAANGAAARAAAGYAARAAAWAAARDADGAADGAAARAALQPTIAQLQLSAIDLYRRMTLVGHENVEATA